MIKVGADPEVFLKTYKGQLKSAIGLIGGTKEKPRKTKFGWVQEDNVSAEFNIEPASAASEFSDRIGLLLSEIEGMVRSSKLTLSMLSAAIFPPEELKDPKALIVGCDPDYQLEAISKEKWVVKENFPPDISGGLRSAGGHIHVSWDHWDGSLEAGLDVVKKMDLYLGVPSVLMDKDTLRKKLYGKAGCFRLQSYGIEYRTLSNFWVFASRHREWAFRQTERAVQNEVVFDGLKVQEAINTNNQDLAKQLCNEYGLEVV